MNTVVIGKPKFELANEPAKRWFNWFFSFEEFELQHLDGTKALDVPKNKRFSIGPYPSKEVAEEYVSADMETNNGWPEIEYLGAYPEGVRPLKARSKDANDG